MSAMPVTTGARLIVAPPEPPTRITTLPNGLTVVVISLPHLHTAAAQILVRAGSRYETARTAGLSHLVEHMLYRGSESYPSAFQLNRALEALGSGLYAETGREVVSYLAECPADNLPEVLPILADALQRPLWKDLEVEKRIVAEEILEDLGEEGQRTRADDVARQIAWPGHPLGLPITGSAESVRRLAEDDLREHHESAYCGENMVLAVAGAISPDATVDAVSALFESLRPGMRQQPRPAHPFDGPRSVHVDHAESQTELDLLLQGLPERHPNNPAQSLLLRILDDGLSTRLHRRIVDEMGLAYQVTATSEPLEDAVLIDLNAACAHDSARPLLRSLLALLTELRDAPPDVEELDMARSRVVWDVQASFDSPRAMTEYYGTASLLRRNHSLSVRVRQILQSSREDVHAAAQTVLTRTRMAAATVGRLTRAQQAGLEELLEGDV